MQKPKRRRRARSQSMGSISAQSSIYQPCAEEIALSIALFLRMTMEVDQELSYNAKLRTDYSFFDEHNIVERARANKRQIEFHLESLCFRANLLSMANSGAAAFSQELAQLQEVHFLWGERLQQVNQQLVAHENFRIVKWRQAMSAQQRWLQEQEVSPAGRPTFTTGQLLGTPVDPHTSSQYSPPSPTTTLDCSGDLSPSSTPTAPTPHACAAAHTRFLSTVYPISPSPSPSPASSSASSASSASSSSSSSFSPSTPSMASTTTARGRSTSLHTGSQHFRQQQEEQARKKRRSDGFHQLRCHYSFKTYQQAPTVSPVPPLPPAIPNKPTVEPLPDVEHLTHFILSLNVRRIWSQECSILALVYLNRAMCFDGFHVPLHAMNWAPLMIASTMVAQKAWDDVSMRNVDFSTLIVPHINVKELNELERRFLRLLNYNVSVSQKLYTQYYFELQALLDDEYPNHRLDHLNNAHPSSQSFEWESACSPARRGKSGLSLQEYHKLKDVRSLHKLCRMGPLKSDRVKPRTALQAHTMVNNTTSTAEQTHTSIGRPRRRSSLGAITEGFNKLRTS